MNKNKSKKTWVFEWLRDAFLLAICVIGIIQITPQIFPHDPTAIPLSESLFRALSFIIEVILAIAAFTLGFIVLFRTYGIIMMVLHPDKNAIDLSITKKSIILSLANGKLVRYPFENIKRMIIGENILGIYISLSAKKEFYNLPLKYKVLEKKIDTINKDKIFSKKEQFIETNNKTESEKGYRTLFYTCK